MTYIKVNNTQYPATITGLIPDAAWDRRDSKSITLTMTAEAAKALLTDDTAWSIVVETAMPTYDADGNPVLDANGSPVTETVTEEYDNTDYCVAGDVIDHRDGTVTVKMGKLTDLELALLAAL